MKRILITLVMLFSTAANAATLIYSSPGVVTAIGDLDIDGELYNVDFQSVAFGTFGGLIEFWVTEAQSIAAVDAINDVLNAGGAPALDNLGVVRELCFGPCYYVWGGDIRIGTTGIRISGDYINVGDGLGYHEAYITAWTDAAVPVPAAVWLFGSGLIGLVGLARRKKA